MEIKLPLLGVLNKDASADSPLRPKWVVSVTADQIASFLQFERKGRRKADPYRATSSSLIQIDPKIQRGDDPEGYHGQSAAKIRDICETLLGKNEKSPRTYIGALVWNVRPPGTLEVATLQVGDKPPRYELLISTNHIYLTDSAHRHFGIAEAVNLSAQTDGGSSRFRPDSEFLVEVYNLSTDHERELFIELNSKQKKIAATKIKELDKSSPIGVLKDAVLRMDTNERGLFKNNIEVTSNTNNKHTLLTMSVFVSTLSEMFDSKEILEGAKDGSVEELARYYCDFTYVLADELRVQVDVDDQIVEWAPIRNLYTEIIEPVEDQLDDENDDATAFPTLLEKRLDVARTKATELNAAFRRQDISNNNATLKALYRIGGDLRQMSDWTKPVKYLQNGLVDSCDGRFFQRSNTDLFIAPESDIPIASLNEDGSINVQVQTKVISRLYRYLRARMGLDRAPSIVVKQGDVDEPVSAQAGFTIQAIPSEEKTLSFFAVVPGLRGVELEPSDVRVAVRVPKERTDLKKCGIERIGQKALESVSLPRLDQSYSHPKYDEFAQWLVPFEFTFKGPAEGATVTLELMFPDERGRSQKERFSLSLSVGT